jgi:hypothetical protein
MSAAFDMSLNERPERRASKRVALDMAVECEISGTRVLDYLSNLSRTGAAIRASRLQAPQGAPIVLRFRIPGTPAKAELHGWVVRTDVDEEGATVAVRFGELSEAVNRALEQL